LCSIIFIPYLTETHETTRDIIFIIYEYFATSSVLWYIIFSVYLYGKLLYGKDLTDNHKFWILSHLCCWLLSALTIIPVAALFYKIDTERIAALVGIIIVFFVFVISNLLYTILIYKIRKLEQANIALSFVSATRTLIIQILIYNMGYLISWGAALWLAIVFGLIGIHDTCNDEWLLHTLGILWQLNGLFNAIMFYVTNRRYTQNINILYILFAPVLLIPYLYSYIKLTWETANSKTPLLAYSDQGSIINN